MATRGRSIVVSLLFAVFGGPGVSLVLVPLWLTHFRIPASEPRGQRVLAAALIAVGLAPGLESVWRFIHVGRGTLLLLVPTEKLVVSGFYRYVRNPMYVGVLIALAGEAMLFESRSMIVFWILLCIGFNLFVRLYEEPTLLRGYGEQFDLYRKHVPRWLPRSTPFHGIKD